MAKNSVADFSPITQSRSDRGNQLAVLRIAAMVFL
jgi:hypothetical protein